MNNKRILAVIMTLVMVFTFAVTVAAEDVLKSEPWVAPENGTNIIAGNKTCVVKADRGNLPEMTDGVVGDKASDNYWTAGDGGAAVPGADPIANNSGAWFQVNLDEVCEIDAIRVGTLVNETAIYHWEAYATDDAEKPLTEWVKIAEKTTDEISNEDGYAVFFDESVQAKVVRIYGTYCNLTGGDNRFRVSEIELWDIVEPETPDTPENPGDNGENNDENNDENNGENNTENENNGENNTENENNGENNTENNGENNTENNGENNTENNGENNTENNGENNTNTEKPDEKGCGGVLSIGAVASMILAGAWVTIAARKN